MSIYNQFPLSIRLTAKLIFVFLLGIIIYIGHDIFVPIYFSILLAIMLLPVTNFMERIGINKTLSNLIAVVTALFIVAIIIYFISLQLSSFADDMPSIKNHIAEHYSRLQNWLKQELNISFKQQTALIEKATTEVKSSGGEYIGQTFSSLTQMLVTIVLVAIYSFLFLYYRHHIKRFLFEVFKKENSTVVAEVINESKNMVRNYMTGLLIEMAIVAVITATAFLIIGIKYAIFLGVLTAILNIIPYIGIFTAALFIVLITLTTTLQTSNIIGALITIVLVHLADSNFLMPKIVGSKVKINTLATIIGVVIGGSMIGLSGIFLALPTIAVLKIIFDRIDALKPWGTLLSDDITGIRKLKKRKIEKIKND